MTYPIADLLDMLAYRRAQGSASQAAFCERYLSPVMSHKDNRGNYWLATCKNPTLAIMAHHDTVHFRDGMQTIRVDQNDFARLAKSSRSECLGGDCTVGVFLALAMIRANIPALYVIHADEESGGHGAQHLLATQPQLFDGINHAVSLDRRGYDSVITHQSGVRTASDAFANEFARRLGGLYLADDGGSFTDSKVYRGVIPECTNISVGYFDAHTKRESVDLRFVAQLRDNLTCLALWDNLPVQRAPVIETKPRRAASWSRRDLWDSWDIGAFDSYAPRTINTMESIVRDYPEQVAEFLQEHGLSVRELLEYCESNARGYRMRR